MVAHPSEQPRLTRESACRYDQARQYDAVLSL